MDKQTCHNQKSASDSVPGIGTDLKPDYDIANRFLDLLTGSTNEAVTFQFFSDRDKEYRKVSGHRTMKRPLTYAFQLKKQKAGCGVYVMVNRGDGKGRKKKNVVKVRAIFIDLDGAPWQLVIGLLKPHIIVESSPGRYHLYWLISDCTLEQFKPLQQAIAKKFGGDKSCCDLPRVLRVPGLFHMKKKPFMTRLVEANDFPKYTSQQIIDGLGLVMDKPATIAPPRAPQTATAVPVSNGHEYIDKSGEVHNLTTWAAKNPLLDIVAAFNTQFARGDIKDGKQHIVCPFEHEHTDQNSDMATYIANADPPKYPAFDIHCMHSHCADRDRLSFVAAMLDKGMLSTEILQVPALEKKSPSKIYFPVNEIASAIEWQSLNADEYRIALHLMTLAWGTNDGTLTADDWLLARRLGLSETEWQSYRETLTRTGWLIEQNGRLTNSIISREYFNAQKALMDAIARGQKGGKARASQNALKSKSSVSRE